ncbi:hypothetical protein ASG88_00490 [Nocardioides sp. Soil777]|uniref:DUF6504 family protein n=1 Tax=Nocardioides sp. Soil777 TaxID=1736409 RepID=UPI0007026B41|nr:DUF6504 family protein [Nocardioides sp. Soil777]KRF07370.1 hypothetical protein ASG88_00490 [Nocardioides sp. Soil777]
MRLYDDPVEVRRGEAEGPDQFLWHGRLWKVRSVLAHWVETAPWWQSTGARAVIGSDDPGDTLTTGSTGTDLLVERELWRVEAGRGSGATGSERSGVFDLSFSWTDGSWQLVGCAD